MCPSKEQIKRLDRAVDTGILLFEMWAFGKPMPGDFDMHHRDAWNELHGDELYIDEDDIMSESVVHMAKLYEEQMDKQINKVKKDIEKDDKSKAKKDVSKLLKMDKKQDAKIAKCDAKMKKK